MPPIKHFVIAAAGMGTRMGADKPKCLLEFNGKSLIEHLLILLEDCEDIRIVVGHNANDIISLIKKILEYITYVINNSYRNITTLVSYILGSRYIKEPVYYSDVDIYFNPSSFREFIEQSNTIPNLPIIGVTSVKTLDYLYTRVNQEKKEVISFSWNLSDKSIVEWEWANISYLPYGFLYNNENKSVYSILEESLSLPAFIIDSYEMDTPLDLANANKALGL